MDDATILEFTEGRKPISELPEGVRAIPLSQGKVALVDAADYSDASRFKWSAHAGDDMWKARRRTVSGEPGSHVYLHRWLMGASPSEQIDHVNHNGLDNRRSKNLRLADNSTNHQNRRKHRGASSRFKGVHLHPTGKWMVQIHDGERSCGHGHKQRYLGLFDSEEEAARRYDEAARAAFGAFACVNFPKPGEQSAARGGK
jgi:hypothetical protein